MRYGRITILLLMACLFGGASEAAAAQPAVRAYALVVGADDYAHLAHLRGAVNDARMLQATLSSLGVEVHTLIDAQATRQAVLEGLRQLVAQAHAGDWVIFTYSGHGWREPVPGSPGQFVNAFLLPGFDSTKAASGERIINHEFRALLQGAPAGVNILFVADSCHSESMTRTIAVGLGKDVLSLRGVPYGPIVEDALPPPPKNAGAETTAALPNVVFIGASLDDQNTPEIALGGQSHGAVSWFLAKALRGESDANHTGHTTLLDLQRYIEVSAKYASESRQDPQVVFAPTRGGEVLPFVRPAVAPPGQPVRPPQPITLVVRGGATPDIAALGPAVNLTNTEAGADFVWDPRAGEVFRSRGAGDLVAVQVTSANVLSGVLDKWRALPAIQSLAARSPLSIEIRPSGNGHNYCEGAVVSISVGPSSNRQLHYLTIVDLTSTGVTQVQYPISNLEGGEQSADLDPGLKSRVTDPFGADHIIAVRTATKPDGLMAILQSSQNRASGSALAAELAAIAARGPYALGVASFYTHPDNAKWRAAGQAGDCVASH